MTQTNTDSRTLWIGDLEAYMDEMFLNQLITQLNYSAYLLSVKVIKDKQTGLPNKYGFIEFASHQIAEKFMQEFNGKLIPNAPNKYFKIKWASYGGGVKITPTSTAGEISIYVGDLDPSVTETMMYQYFKPKYPSVFTTKIICDNLKVSKGFGFVKFTNNQQAQRSIAQNNGAILAGKAMKVSHAYMKNKQQKQQEEQQQGNQAGQMIKIYQKYFSMANDPLLNMAYQKQLEKSFGSEAKTEKSLKQRLQNLKVLPYQQTKNSEKYLDSLMKTVSYQSKKQVQGIIFTI